jgi:hypothetical protein
MKRAALVLAVTALGAVACGRKADPMPRELVAPLPPEELGAVATPEGIRLTWQRPLEYSGGQRMNDLAGFTVERAPAAAPAPAPFAEVGRVQVTDQTRFRKERRQEWTDHAVERGVAYLYRVIAFTLDGYRSAPSAPVRAVFGTTPPAKEPPS